MEIPEELKSLIVKLLRLKKGDNDTFNHVALSIFRYQYENIRPFGAFCDMLHVSPDTITHFKQIPCLPTQAFQKHKLHDNVAKEILVFRSSSTTGQIPSVHIVNDAGMYTESFIRGFTDAYPTWMDAHFYALLPGYLERSDSSLVYMCDHLIKKSAGGGFYLNQFESLAKQIRAHEETGNNYFLLGVSYALLDFCAAFPMEIKNGIIIETGGMKGKRKEMCKDELHAQLSEGFGTKKIHGEYGMTELLSQAYAKEDQRYYPSAFMRVKIMDVNDPLREASSGEAGMLHVIDLANIHSCSFVATSDLGRVYNDGSFEVLGRFDLSEQRGCNLMIPS